MFTTITGGVFALIAVSSLRYYHRVGFLDFADRRHTIVLLAALGAGIGIAVLNWLRLLRHRPLLHPAWVLVLLLVVLGCLLPGSMMHVRF